MVPTTEDLEVLLAWEAEELSLGQVCHLVNMDPVAVREMREEILARVRSRWGKWRDSNPPSPVLDQ